MPDVPTAATDRWAAPTPVSDVQVAFPAGALDLMPSWEECEAALAALPDGGEQWREFQARWFFNGLPATTTFDLAEGVDGATALRHLKVIQGSFEPKHEHKEAAVAYLASRWFTSVEGWR